MEKLLSKNYAVNIFDIRKPNNIPEDDEDVNVFTGDLCRKEVDNKFLSSICSITKNVSYLLCIVYCVPL